MHKKITPNSIHDNKPIFSIWIVKLQPSSVPIVLCQLLWLRIRIGLRLRLGLVVLVILRVIHHLLHVHVIISRVLWWVVLSHRVARIHVLRLLVVTRNLSLFFIKNMIHNLLFVLLQQTAWYKDSYCLQECPGWL